ncbi:MAG: hypothetical protein WA054_02110 [Candidatus Moraniibacteriota bacterium]
MHEFPLPSEKKEVISKPEAVDFDIEGESFRLKKYAIGDTPEGGIISPGLMETGALADVRRLYEKNRDQERIPGRFLYAFLDQKNGKTIGDYSLPAGQDEFNETDLKLTNDPFAPPQWAEELWEYAALKRKKVFTLDSTLACIRGLALRDGKPVFTLGAGQYSQSFFSNGAEGTTLGVSVTEMEKLSKVLTGQEYERLAVLSSKLVSQYGQGKPLREVVLHRRGHLPEFNEHVFNNNIGVVAMVLTSDQQFVYATRGANVSIFQGVDATASGAAEFDEKTLSRYGLQHFLGNEMQREIREEVGFKSGSLLLGAMKKRLQLELGMETDEYELVPIAFMRELIRGGKPECMFLARYKGSVEDVVRSIRENKYADKKEIEGFVYAQSADEAVRMSEKEGADGIIQHRAAAHLSRIGAYLRNNN